MACEDTGDTLAKRNSCLVPAGSFNCEARCCCVVDDVVWVADLKGGISLYDSHSGSFISRVAVSDPGDPLPHIKCMTLVHCEVWAGDIAGNVYVFHSLQRKRKSQFPIRGVEASAPVSSLYFDGHSVLAASETGRVVQWNPFTKRQINVFHAAHSVLSVAVAAGFVVAGDRAGAVCCFDPISGEVVAARAHDAAAVLSLLAEPRAGTLWAGRKNGTISFYTFDSLDSLDACGAKSDDNSSDALRFVGRAKVGDGAVTSMIAVSGKVVATSYQRSIAVFHATTRELITRVEAAHGAFIHNISRVHCAETVRAWTFGNDGRVRLWDIAGFYVPAQSVPPLSPFQQAAMAENAKSCLSVENAQLSACAAAAKGRVADVREELRLLKDELHEHRVLKGAHEEVLKVKDLEILEKDRRVKELENDVKKLNKETAESNARADAAQKELTMLRQQLLQAQKSATEASAQISAGIKSKAEIEQQLSALRTERSHLEIRLRDRDAEVTQLKGENMRLLNKLVQPAPTEGINKNTDAKKLDPADAARQSELEELRKKSHLLSATLVSMEYSIRRKEEEERDMTVLLNAFRRKITGCVTDAHLCTLLNVTMLRHPSRFELECDEHLKAQLRDRSGPFIRFLQMLRSRDAESYDQLVKYIQHPEAGSQFNAVYDRLLSLAQKESATNEGDIVSFKRDLPVLLGSLNAARGGR